MRIWLMIVFAISTLFGFEGAAQEFGNTNLRLGLYQNETVRCFVKAQPDYLNQFLVKNNGRYFSIFRGWSKIELSANKLKEISDEPWCESIRIKGGTGVTLGDISKINTKTHLVHQGKVDHQPGYTGEGIIMGFIDTGIDFTQPDFKNKDGSTRILKLWDQAVNNDTTLRPHFGYGEVYSSTMINNGSCTHIDPAGHGTQVTGLGVGNGLSVPDSVADYSGHAPQADMLFVATDFRLANWTLTVAEGVQWIFEEAEKLGKPCVVNLSLGTYLGGHDGKDLAAQLIDSLVAAKPGRFVVCAAGNAGNLAPFHLRTDITNDTSIKYFKQNKNSSFGNAVFIEGWGDTNDLKDIQLGFGYTDPSTYADFLHFVDSVSNLLDTTIVRFVNGGTSLIFTFAEEIEGRIMFQILMVNPLPNMLYGLVSVGTGKHDIWNSAAFGLNDIMRSNLPTVGNYPLMSKYTYPDSLQSVVSSWNCSPSVISVGNYNNRYGYLNQFDSMRITVDFPVGGLGTTSSIGPTRSNIMKPDVAAPGNLTVSAGRFQDLNALKTIPHVMYRLAKGGYHFANGGTSMASPAVAGIAAMYLEKCPKATCKEIKDAVIKNTFSDVHTGTLPNLQFGYGKVDA